MTLLSRITSPDILIYCVASSATLWDSKRLWDSKHLQGPSFWHEHLLTAKLFGVAKLFVGMPEQHFWILKTLGCKLSANEPAYRKDEIGSLQGEWVAQIKLNHASRSGNTAVKRGKCLL